MGGSWHVKYPRNAAALQNIPDSATQNFPRCIAPIKVCRASLLDR